MVSFFTPYTASAKKAQVKWSWFHFALAAAATRRGLRCDVYNYTDCKIVKQFTVN